MSAHEGESARLTVEEIETHLDAMGWDRPRAMAEDLAPLMAERLAAARAEGVRALLAAAEGDQFPNPSSVPLRQDNGYVSITTLRHRAAWLADQNTRPGMRGSDD